MKNIYNNPVQCMLMASYGDSSTAHHYYQNWAYICDKTIESVLHGSEDIWDLFNNKLTKYVIVNFSYGCSD